MKACTKCKVVKPPEDYHRQTKARDGRASWCKQCTKGIYREQRKRVYSTENKRRWAIKSRYKVSVEQIDALFAKQKGLCGICNKPLGRYHIDHDHDTKEVRGLLCHGCNIKIGGWDNRAWRKAAARWLGMKIAEE